MNRDQKIIAFAMFSIMILMAFIPPFKVQIEGGFANLGYHLIFSPPLKVAIVNIAQVTIQELVTIIVGLAAWFLAADKKRESHKDDNAKNEI